MESVQPRTLQVCHGIPNLYTFHGPIESYTNDINDVEVDMNNDADSTTTTSSDDDDDDDDDDDKKKKKNTNHATNDENENSENENIIIGVALHVCGEATDIAIRHSINQLNASGLVVAPCCVGKLNTNVLNPYIYHATQQNTPTIQYPQSQLLRTTLVPTSTTSSNNTNDSKEELVQRRRKQQQEILVEDWNSLAKAADYNDSCNIFDCNTPRNACRRLSKSLLEVDRQLYIQQVQQQEREQQVPQQDENETNFGGYCYETLLTRMVPWEASPKNDIIMAWRKSQMKNEKFQWEPCDSCNADVNWVKQHLFQPPQTLLEKKTSHDGMKCEDKSPPTGTSSSEAVESAVGARTAQRQHQQQDRVDWTVEEEEEIVQKLRSIFPEFTDTATSISSCNYVFPPQDMNKRKRKLVHYVAARLNLKSWGQGKKHSEKTVVVSKKKM